MFFWRVYEYSFVFGWFSRKMDEIMKVWANYGVLRCGVGIPRSSVGLHQGVACPRRYVAEREDLASLGYAQGTKNWIFRPIYRRKIGFQEAWK